MIEDVKIIVAEFGAEVKARVDTGKLDELPQLTDDATTEICQLFKPDRPDREKIAQLLCDKANPMMSDIRDHSFWEEMASEPYKIGFRFTADQILALIEGD